MKLKGIIDHVFGNQLCFRGFAKIGDLAKISNSNNKYQRNHDEKRIEEIKAYYKGENYRFFPELTLCMNIEDSDSVSKIVNGTKHILNNGIQYIPTAADFRKYITSDKLIDPALRSVAFDIPDSLGIDVLTRIDGNHRLSAIDNILNLPENEQRDFSEVLNYIVPFNILIQSQSIESEKNETAYFHLINSKANPLTSEENLKSLFKQDLFTDDEVSFLISDKATIARALYFNFDHYKFLGLHNVIGDSLKSFFLDVVQLENIDNDLEKLQNSIQLIDNLVFENISSGKSININVILALIWVKNQYDNSRFKTFKQWIFTNHLNEIVEIKPETLVNIFESIHTKRTYKIFVAMPYWSHPEVTEYNTLFKEICKEVSSKLNTIVELIPIMRFAGKSQRIDTRLLKSIKECDVFIADITGCNKNVIFEVGLAEGLNKPMILLKDEKDPKIPPFDMDKLQYVPYNKSVYFSAIKGIATRNLLSLLRQDFEIL